jgi:hypothetical protein
MKRFCAWISLLASALLAIAAAGCATTGEGQRNSDYYRRSTIHRDSFPVNYNPGRVGRVGRPYWY